MTWVGRYVLGGHAIADEARVLDEDGGLKAHFITLRFYERETKRWIVEAWNLLESRLTRQAPDDLGGVKVSESSITYMTRLPHALGRESFLTGAADRFTYRLDVSTDDGETWIDGVDSIEATRMPD